MFRKVFSVLLTALLAFILSSCLTCERKEYIFQLTGENSGRLIIRYINIFSNSIDSAAEISSDYDELVNMWLKGEKIERDFPKATKFRKRLYEQNGQLCGEVIMEFTNLSDVRLYRYNHQGPYMFSMSAVPDDGENFIQCSGEFGGDQMPVVFWPLDAQELRFSTSIAKPDSSCVSLLDLWRADNSQKSKWNVPNLIQKKLGKIIK
ncbi:MAG: hypothetical protein HXX13_00690 [Bacteroidetes bacterium]|nr:hypothetical protein [Bacteroidota bacterium]